MITIQTKCIWVSVLLFKQLWLKLVLLLDCYDQSATGMVTLSPMTVAPVCHVGDPLQITCTASVDFIRWSFLRVNEQGTLNKISSDALINSRDSNNQMSPIIVESTTFTAVRTSPQFASPLISTLSTDSVNIGLNATIVNCSDVMNPMTYASITIQIVDTSQNFQYTPMLNILDEHYEADGVTVTVVWAQRDGITYTARVSPSVPIISTGSTSHQLTILYNTEYNFSVEAVAPCGQNPMAYSVLNYAKCEYPDLMPVCTMTCNTDSIPRVLGKDDIIRLEGSTIRFGCPPGLELVGPSSATCTRNGEWGPDISGLMCNASKSDLIELTCNCNNSEGNFQESRPTECSLAAAVSSSVLIFLITSILVFIIGFMFGRYFQTRKRALHITTDHPGHQGPVYDYVQPASTMKHQENLELKVNVAYHPSKSITIEH